MRRILYENGLSLVMALLFLGSLVGHALTGLATHNDEQREHGQPALGLGEFLTSGEFGETIFENWESEFLQMGMFVLLTVSLRQRGSAESDKLDDEEGHDQEVDDPEKQLQPDSPAIVRRGGWPLALYQHSLGLTFMLLFAASFVLHAVTGADNLSDERQQHGLGPISTWAYLGNARLWYESFQNWQSEFLSVLAMVVLTIFLRERGSAESKHVAAPHRETGK